MDELRVVLTIVAVLGSGLIGGVFFAFSTFVMKALATQPPAQGAATMQSINVTVLNGWFLSSFLGTAVAGAALWAEYVTGWTAWNTVRTIASLLAAAVLTVALIV